ncbi:MAG: hypothetical protein LAQ30_25780 [Acidobacteriia bacterium]|nr:hypothetical protein [Terriglobia bacterium]
MRTAWMVPLMVLGAGLGTARVILGPPDMTVVVHLQTAGRGPGADVLEYARRTAAGMFASIGVRVAWAAPGEGEPANGLVLHLYVTDRPQTGHDPAALAFAYPYAPEKGITVMWDRLLAVCGSGSELVPRLLAHVMVHELTHVLEGVSRHSDTGVMKAHWTAGDYSEMMRKPLPFTDFDAELIHGRVDGTRAN